MRKRKRILAAPGRKVQGPVDSAGSSSLQAQGWQTARRSGKSLTDRWLGAVAKGQAPSFIAV